MGTCRHCGQKAGFLRKQHSQCRDLHGAGIQEMVQLAAQAASTHTFNEVALSASPSRPSPSAVTPRIWTSSRPWRKASPGASPRR